MSEGGLRREEQPNSTLPRPSVLLNPATQ